MTALRPRTYRSVVPTLVALGILLAPTTVFGQVVDCSRFVVMDTSRVLLNQQARQSLKDTVRSRHFSSAKQARDSGFGLGIPVPVAETFLNVKLDGHDAWQNWSQWSMSFDKTTAFQAESLFHWEDSRAVLSDNARKLAAECLSVPGLKGTIATTSLPNQVRISLAYKRHLDDETVRLGNVQVRSTTGPLPACENAIRKAFPDIIPQHETSVLCSWEKTQGVEITINSSPGAGSVNGGIPPAPNVDMLTAVRLGDVRAMEDAFAQGWPTNGRIGDTRETALTVAADTEHDRAVEALLARSDVDINASNSQGATALHNAATGCRVKIVALLLAHGATSDTRLNSSGPPTNPAWTPRCMAQYRWQRAGDTRCEAIFNSLPATSHLDYVAPTWTCPAGAK